MSEEKADYPAAVKRRSWTLRACALLLLVYSFLWGYLGVTALLSMQRPLLPRGSPGLIGILYAMIVVGLIMCPLLLAEAVLLWRASPVGVVLALLTSLSVALPLVLFLGSEALYAYTHPALFDWKFTLGDIALLIVGPGLVIVLLFVPSSYRAWGRR